MILLMRLLAALAVICSSNVLDAVVVPEDPEPIVEVKAYSDEDVYWLSRVIYAESGADYCSDELQLAVGSVVLNRVKSNLYPDNIREVIFDSEHGCQYGCTKNGMIYLDPNQRAIDNAVYLLENGPQLPADVLGQAHTNTLREVYKVIDSVVFSRI